MQEGASILPRLCNFYRHFIKDFSHVTHPLHHLTGHVPWKWGLEQQLALEELKLCVTSEPVLVIPTDDAPLCVEADTSNFATGAILLQQAADSNWHPVAFFSKSLSEAEYNYKIYDKELLAIMFALEEWRQYLLGAHQKFEIWLDHHNLTDVQEACKLNRHQARGFTDMQEYNFTLLHKPGGMMGRPDVLSREAGHERGVNDNQAAVPLKSELFQVLLRNTAIDFEGDDKSILRCIKDSKFPHKQLVITALLLKSPCWKKHADGLLTRDKHIYVPSDEALCADIIKVHHSMLAAGHPGRCKIEEIITCTY